MGLISILYFIFAAVIAFYLVFPFLTVLISRSQRDPIQAAPFVKEETDFACIITAYKNVEITKSTVQALLKQQYQNFHIYLVCDGSKYEDYGIKDERFTVFFPDPSLNLKAKSIIHAMDNYVRAHSYTVIFDADNIAHPDFLRELNKYTSTGMRSVQGQRTAKNLDGTYASGDSAGEFYKNYIERLVPYLIGSSSVISGSGMAVQSDLYRAYLDSPAIQVGKEKWKKMLQEDKILQNFLLRKKEKISYAWDAVVFDEKVTTGSQVETQRARWIYSYFQNLPNSTGIFARGLFGFNLNQLLFGLITMAPPLFLLVFGSMAAVVLGYWINPMMSLVVLGAGFIFVLNFVWTLALSGAPSKMYSGLWKSLPMFAIRQVKGLYKMLNPNKYFAHTEHKHKDLTKRAADDILAAEKEVIQATPKK